MAWAYGHISGAGMNEQCFLLAISSPLTTPVLVVPEPLLPAKENPTLGVKKARKHVRLLFIVFGSEPVNVAWRGYSPGCFLA
jgi:hypothetical protein